MIDKDMLIRIVSLADLNKTDTVLEIGGGAGALTEYLLKIAKEVYVIEQDKKYIQVLDEKFSHHKKVMFMVGNAMEMQFPEFTKCVSNLPYTICEPLLWKMTRYDYELLVFVVPAKFVKLLTGQKESRLKFVIDAFYELEIFDDVPPEAFEPRPRVYSKIIRLRKKKGNLFLREFLSQYDKRTKNALRQILVKSGMTKREATEKVALTIRPMLQTRKVANLSLAEIKEVIKNFLESKA
tara:strand:+ start:5744 stop:6457 length:714 start_codon:yes stop_codon:yes gene_type:complete